MDFDSIIDRRGTGAVKWGASKGAEDVVNLWVADMDFAAPKEVEAALRERIAHPVYGYTEIDPAYIEALRAWYADRYGAEVASDAFLLGPAVVPCLGMLARTLAAEGEGVLYMPPVYGPFAESVRLNGRVPVAAPLDRTDPFRMRLDLEGAAAAVEASAARGVPVRALFFCSPHNPGGVLWTRGELAAVLEFAERKDLVVVCDEIHADLVRGPSRFVSLAGFPGTAERTIVVSAANKTFNLAGLALCHLVAPDAALRARAARGLAAAGFHEPNVLSQTAALAAYRNGAPWLDELKRYLDANLAFAADFIRANVPGVRSRAPEATYLLWADAAELIGTKGLRDDRELVARLEAEGRVKLTAGSAFGEEGRNFVRINAACPRSVLEEGLRRWAAWAAEEGN